MMVNPDEQKVAIVKTGDNIRAAVKKSIDLLGGLTLRKGEIVVLKPNFVGPRDSNCGVTTNLDVIDAVFEEVKARGGSPIIYEFPGMEYKLSDVSKAIGLNKFEGKWAVKKVRDNEVKVNIQSGSTLRSVRVPKLLLTSKIINLPKLKAHSLTKVSVGMKNLMGALSDNERRNMHIHDLDKAIVDINSVIRPVLTIVDGTIVMEQDAVYGNKIDLGVLISGYDVLSVDNVCCRLMGLEPSDVRHIRLANKKFGSPKVTFMGENIDSLKRTFELPNKSFLYKTLYKSMYVFDLLFSHFSENHFNAFLYSTGHFGTRIKIDKSLCDECRKCLDICPVTDAIDLYSGKINAKNCIRCISCFEICPKKAIYVKGLTKPEGKSEKM